MPNALENLLVNKYGVSPEDAAAYAAQIVNQQGGTHGDQLKAEALGGVAQEQVGVMDKLGKFPQAVSAAQGGNAMGLSPQDLDFAIGLLDQSRETTANNAKAAGVASTEAARMDTMANQAGGFPKPAGASTTFVTVPHRGAVTEFPVDPRPDPYEAKLQRATALRKQILGI